MRSLLILVVLDSVGVVAQVEHVLVMCVGLFRAFNMLNYYYLYNYIPIVTLTVVSGVPHLFTSWIFTFVIFAWSATHPSCAHGQQLRASGHVLISMSLSLDAWSTACVFGVPGHPFTTFATSRNPSSLLSNIAACSC